MARFLLVLLTTLGACAHGIPIVGNIGTLGFARYTSPHFQLITDGPAWAAQGLIEELEQSRSALVEVSGFPDRPGKLNVVAFEHIYLMREIVGREKFDGMFLPAGEPFFDSESTLLINMDGGFFAHLHRIRVVLTHETAHWLLRGRIATLPRWIDEGLAHYYETLEFDHETNEAVVGLVPEGTPPHAGWPKVGELLAADSAIFHSDREAAFYAGAWGLCYVLQTQHVEQWKRLLDALAKGNTAAESWESTGLTAAQLDAEIDARFSSNMPLGRRTPVHLQIVGPDEAYGMSDAEAHLAFIRLRNVHDAEGRKHAADDLRFAEAQLPNDRRVLLWKARFAAQENQINAAVELTGELIGRDPTDLQALTLWIGAQLDQLHANPNADTLASLENDATRLEQNGAVAALRIAAQYRVMTTQADHAIRLLTQAVAKEPSCWPCLDQLSRVYEQHGDRKKAIECEERAAGIASESGQSKRLLNRLKKLRNE